MEKATAAVAKAVAGLPADAAAARLAAHAAGEPPGLRRRALLAARIAVMRRALDAPEPEIEVKAVAAPPPPPPEPEPEPEPVPVVKAPKPLSKGVMMSVNLDDVARMLSAPAEEPQPQEAAPAAVAEPEATSAPGVTMPDPAALFAALDWEGTAARLEPAEVPRSAEEDMAEAWGSWSAATEEEPRSEDPAPEPMEAAARDDVPPVAGKGGEKRAKARMATVDPGAALAALAAAEPPADTSAAVAAAAKPKPLAIDLSAQFAAMDGLGGGADSDA